MKQHLLALGRRILSVEQRRKIVRYSRWPLVGWIRFGSLRRLRPISAAWGSERGTPIDRYYIERFLREHAGDIRGRVLEIKEDLYASHIGGSSVTQVDVVHPVEGNPKATIVADLTNAAQVPSNSFDCVIFTQTLQLIYDADAAIATLHRILKPGGVLLATVSGISKISRDDMDRWGHYWQFTTRSVSRMLGDYFPLSDVDVASHGNVLTAAAFLHGAAVEDLREHELQFQDPDYQLLITARAVKAVSAK